jgi:hypothetical protein
MALPSDNKRFIIANILQPSIFKAMPCEPLSTGQVELDVCCLVKKDPGQEREL